MNVSSFLKDKEKYFALSRRKTSVTKLFLVPNGEGKVFIRTGKHNNYKVRTAQEYFKDDYVVKSFLVPLSLFQSEKKYDIYAHVSGGGLISQAAGIKLAIAKSLLEENYSLKPQLKTYKLLTQDTRSKERKKIGKYGARRSPQFTKR